MLDPIKYLERDNEEFSYDRAPLDIFFPLPSRVIFHEVRLYSTQQLHNIWRSMYSF